MNEHLFNIADWGVHIRFECAAGVADMRLLKAFAPFETSSEKTGEQLFSLTVVDKLQMEEGAEPVRVCDTGNGDIVVEMLKNGGYQFVIKNLDGEECALMQSTADFSQCRCSVTGNREQRRFGMNNALMMAYAFAGSVKSTLLVHASVVRCEGNGYAFVAKSGTGKSTQVANWLRVIPHCDLLNDDNPIVRIIDGEAYIYGSPWSGKTPCYRNVKAPLKAITQIVRAKENNVAKLPPVIGLKTVLEACSSMRWDVKVYRGICDTVSALIEKVGVYALQCTAETESAVVCHKALTEQ